MASFSFEASCPWSRPTANPASSPEESHRVLLHRRLGRLFRSPAGRQVEAETDDGQHRDPDVPVAHLVPEPVVPGPVVPGPLAPGPVVPGPVVPGQGFWLLVLGLSPAHQRADDIGLVTGRDLRAHPLPCSRVLFGPVQPDGCHRRPPERQLVEDGLVEITVNRHRRGARNWGCSHHEHVGMPVALLGL